jgi:hypothetical protein
MVITKVDVWSAARISGALYAVVGLLVGLLLALIASVGGFAQAFGGEDGAPAFVGMLFGIGGIIVLPILYGLLGLVGGAIAALLYNLIAGVVGGIQVETR